MEESSSLGVDCCGLALSCLRLGGALPTVFCLRCGPAASFSVSAVIWMGLQLWAIGHHCALNAPSHYQASLSLAVHWESCGSGFGFDGLLVWNGLLLFPMLPHLSLQSEQRSSTFVKSNGLKWKSKLRKESAGFANGSDGANPRFLDMPVEDLAATRIQTTFKAYGAWKALRHFRGPVRLLIITQNQCQKSKLQLKFNASVLLMLSTIFNIWVGKIVLSSSTSAIAFMDPQNSSPWHLSKVIKGFLFNLLSSNLSTIYESNDGSRVIERSRENCCQRTQMIKPEEKHCMFACISLFAF